MITGANGFLAQHLCIFLTGKGFDVIAVSRGNCRIPKHLFINYTTLELTDVSSVQHFIEYVQPQVIIHVAAMSKPDECEFDQPACILNNVTATKNLLEASQNKGIHFIYISTDFIFGEDGPHAENDEPQPLNFYGASKLMAENCVKELANSYTIIRPVFIYGKHWEGMRYSFIQWVAQQLKAEKNIKVVSDQLRTPTYVNDICWGIAQIIQLKKLGVYHLAGKDICSPYTMALTVAKVLNLDASLIEEVNSDSFPEPVKRSKKSGLLIHKAIMELNYNPLSFEEGVKKSFS